ncbi:hypothetical protein B0H11DRAFT_1658847, partial [Mycena galericulata]
NNTFLEHENRLWELLGLVHFLPPCVGKERLEERISREIQRCSLEKELHWNQQRLHLDINRIIVSNEINFVPISRWEPGVLVAMVVTAMMTELFHVPRQGGSVLLAGFRDMLNAAPGQHEDPPKDPRTIHRQLNLDPVTETYLCCPTCWALTPFCAVTDNPVTEQDPDPAIPLCQDRLTSGSDICGEELWKKERIKSRVKCTPRLTYIHQSVKTWLGRLLSRPGIEEILQNYPIEASGTPGGRMSDIWGSPAIKALRGPDGNPFFEVPVGESRYLFSIAVDGFNPLHNKTAKQVVTSTGFWLVLLNFPTHLRYLFENMCFLGAGPGPTGPTVGRLNPFLKLIVRDFLEFWNPGVFFTRTYKYRHGRDTKAMLIPLTADMLAAREVSGFTSSTSTYFCIGCYIDMAHIEEFDRTKWPLRSHAQHLKDANAWKDAATPEEQNKITQKTGVRWAELLELPYWKATVYAALVEAMHALDLDIIQRHIRVLFGIDLSADGGDGSEPRVPRPDRPSSQRMARVLKLFHLHRMDPNMLEVLLKDQWVDFKTLWHICNDRNLRVASTKKSRSWFILRIRKWMDETPDEEQLLIPPAKEEVDSLKKLVSDAENAIKNSVNRYPEVTEVQITLCISVSKALYRGTKLSSLARATAFIFTHLCRVRFLDESGTRSDMYDRLIREVYELLQIEVEKSDLPPEAVVNRGAVLGYDVMRATWEDMRKTILPSWVGAAPKNWGTSKRGKLSADHWRTIFTIHLPITLIWLWRDETGRKKLLLENMVSLIMSVLTANLKETDAGTADQFDECYGNYMSGVAELFRENTITPSQHSAFHIGQNLRDFGPQHARSAHHYERYIHHLQRQNTNGKFGEMENTFMYSTQRMANIKALISDNTEIRSHVTEAIKVYDRESLRDSRGVRLVQILDPMNSHFDVASKSRWSALSMQERQLLQNYLSSKYADVSLESWQSSASIMDQISLNDARYARKNVLKYDQDSHIIFRQPGTNQVSPGQILNIFQFWLTSPDPMEIESTYLVVERFGVVNLGLGRQDPYKKYPKPFGYLAGEVVATELIETRHVKCHFALTPIEFNNRNLIHVFPMNRVSFSISSSSI